MVVSIMEKINLVNLYDTSKDEDKLLKLLNDWGLIPLEGVYKCPNCSGVLTLSKLKLITEQLEFTKKYAVDGSSFCREVLFYSFIIKKEPLGGEGKIVKIEQSKFGKRKYNRGHYVQEQWVFGGYERGSGRVFMIPVDYRDADTLLPVIQDWI